MLVNINHYCTKYAVSCSLSIEKNGVDSRSLRHIVDGRIMSHSSSWPGPSGERKSFSWLFLSVKMPFITVHIRALNTRGA